MASCVHAYGPADPRTAAAAQALSEARVMLAIERDLSVLTDVQRSRLARVLIGPDIVTAEPVAVAS